MRHRSNMASNESGNAMKRQPHPEAGFSLIEMAIVFVVVALLIGGLLVPFSTQVEQQKVRETQKAMEEIKEALIGYAMTNKYLPCPDTNGDGLEEARVVATGACPSSEGRAPWSTLGVVGLDGWGRRFRYRVTPAFSNSMTTFALSSSGTLRVCQQQACTSTLATNVPAVIVSHGKNGYGARQETGSVVEVPAGLPSPGDEMENINGRNAPTPGNATADTLDSANVDFVSHPFSDGAAGEFDDLVTWLSPNILFNRMVAAGRLP